MTKFEIDHQYCKCGKINDSRQDGALTSRFCTECRKKYGKGMRALSRKLKDAHKIANPANPD